MAPFCEYFNTTKSIATTTEQPPQVIRESFVEKNRIESESRKDF